MKQRAQSKESVQPPEPKPAAAKRIGVLDQVLAQTQVILRTAKDIEEKTEAVELERILLERKSTLQKAA